MSADESLTGERRVCSNRLARAFGVVEPTSGRCPECGAEQGHCPPDCTAGDPSIEVRFAETLAHLSHLIHAIEGERELLKNAGELALANALDLALDELTVGRQDIADAAQRRSEVWGTAIGDDEQPF